MCSRTVNDCVTFGLFKKVSTLCCCVRVRDLGIQYTGSKCVLAVCIRILLAYIRITVCILLSIDMIIACIVCNATLSVDDLLHFAINFTFIISQKIKLNCLH